MSTDKPRTKAANALEAAVEELETAIRSIYEAAAAGQLDRDNSRYGGYPSDDSVTFAKVSEGLIETRAKLGATAASLRAPRRD